MTVIKLALLGLVLSTSAAMAELNIQFNVTSSTTLEFTFSGSIDPSTPQPDYSRNILFVDITGPVQAAFSDISGSARIASYGVSQAYVGYASTVYDGPLQLRFDSYFQPDQTASGTSVITFSSAHELTNSMFIDGVTGIYWGTNEGNAKGQLVGYASAPIPEPATYATIFAAGILGFAIFYRRRK